MTAPIRFALMAAAGIALAEPAQARLGEDAPARPGFLPAAGQTYADEAHAVAALIGREVRAAPHPVYGHVPHLGEAHLARVGDVVLDRGRPVALILDISPTALRLGARVAVPFQAAEGAGPITLDLPREAILALPTWQGLPRVHADTAPIPAARLPDWAPLAALAEDGLGRAEDGFLPGLGAPSRI